MKSRIIFFVGLLVMGGILLISPKEASAHSGWKCWPMAVTYDNGATTYNFQVCGWTKSGHGNELAAAVSNPAIVYALYFSPAPCGNVVARLLSSTTNPPSCTPSNTCSGDSVVEQCSGSTTPCPYGCANGTCNTCPDGICAQCGASSNQTVQSVPTSNLCTQGTASGVSVQLGSRAWQWGCTRSHAGNNQTATCSAVCPSGKWVCDGQCISVASSCHNACVGSRQLIGNVCAGSDTTTTGTGTGAGTGIGGFGVESTTTKPEVTLAARILPDTTWHQASPLVSFTITAGKVAELAWAVVGASDCTGSSPFFSTLVSTSTKTTITESQTFTLTCKNKIDSDTKTVKVLVPSVVEF